jgi:predicted metalloprotease with PDZ domain
MNRAGLLSQEEVFDYLSSSIRNYENIPGSLFQSATESSFDTWIIQLFNKNGNSRNTTISYYDKGCGLGLLLDLAIRNGSDNMKSLDDVMRTLYYDYFLEKERGFTDEEFRSICEEAAATSLEEIFDVYAATTAEIDYSKYLAYAGLDIDTTYKKTGEAFLGAQTRNINGELVITGIDWDSPAWHGGLSERDQIISIDGEEPPGSLEEILNASKPGERLIFTVKSRNLEHELEVELGEFANRSFKIVPVSNPDSLQSALLKDWIK